MKYVYRPAEAPEQARRSALQYLLDTLFAGSAGGAIATIVDLSAWELSPEEYDRVARLIEDARHEQE
jgi:hypothetical protein